MYLLSDDHLTQMTCCMRFVWYTSLHCGMAKQNEDMQYKHLYIVIMQDCKTNSGQAAVLLSTGELLKKEKKAHLWTVVVNI